MTHEELNALKEKLTYKKKNAYDVMTEEDKLEMEKYVKGYMHFIDECKTEREAVKYAVELAKGYGYSEYKFGMSVKAGDKLYYNNRGKELFAVPLKIVCSTK